MDGVEKNFNNNVYLLIPLLFRRLFPARKGPWFGHHPFISTTTLAICIRRYFLRTNLWFSKIENRHLNHPYCKYNTKYLECQISKTKHHYKVQIRYRSCLTLLSILLISKKFKEKQCNQENDSNRYICIIQNRVWSKHNHRNGNVE